MQRAHRAACSCPKKHGRDKRTGRRCSHAGTQAWREPSGFQVGVHKPCRHKLQLNIASSALRCSYQYHFSACSARVQQMAAAEKAGRQEVGPNEPRKAAAPRNRSGARDISNSVATPEPVSPPAAGRLSDSCHVPIWGFSMQVISLNAVATAPPVYVPAGTGGTSGPMSAQLLVCLPPGSPGNPSSQPVYMAVPAATAPMSAGNPGADA